MMLERERSAMEELEGTHFEIPEQIRTIDVRLRPEGRRPRRATSSRRRRTSAGPAPRGGPSATRSRCRSGTRSRPPTTRASRATTSSAACRCAWATGSAGSTASCTGSPATARAGRSTPSGSCASSATSTVRSSCSGCCPRTPCGRCGWSIDIGSHLELPIPDDVPFHPGEQWTFDLGGRGARALRLPHQRPRRLRDHPVPGLAGPGHLLQGGRAGHPRPARGGPRQGGRRLRPEGVPRAGARLRPGRARPPARDRPELSASRHPAWP